MILSKLVRAIKEQNYFAVVLEFLIVIAGIVIAFQVTEWDAERTKKQRASDVATRLLQDLRAEQWRMQATENFFLDAINAGEFALKSVQGSVDVSDEDLVINAFRASRTLRVGVIRASFDELVASGSLDLVLNSEFRALAVEYYNAPGSVLLINTNRMPYRERVRQFISPALHRALVDQCGIGFLDVGNYEALERVLSFPCSIDGLEEDVKSFANFLRSDELIIQLLRQHVIEVDQYLRAISYYRGVLERAVSHS